MPLTVTLGKSLGVLVSVVVASAIGLLLIVTLIWCLLRKRRAERDQQSAKDVMYKPGEKEEKISKV
ncbi:hypothetical protein JZ751_019684 [Albula glossodonta]|uniref:Uncharacterized protein n=1 Tax=Albula glossodonta TaxID=121402 RepID=A0A8T2NKI8_9TELE|nr:hypothetical protein JZ751_019684 [Albula glossodonta]